MQVTTQTISGKVAVCGQDKLTEQLAQILQAGGFSIFSFDPHKTALPVLVQPDYLFQVVSALEWITQLEFLKENLTTLALKKPKLIILGENLSEQQKLQLETKLTSWGWQAQKFNFLPSTQTDDLNVVLERTLGAVQPGWTNLQFGVDLPLAQEPLAATQIVDLPTTPSPVVKIRRHPGQAIKLTFLVVTTIFILFLTIVLAVTLPFLQGVNDLEYVQSNLSISRAVELRAHLNNAYDHFNAGQGNLSHLAFLFNLFGQQDNLSQLDNLFSLAKITTEAGNSALATLPTIQKIVTGVADPLTPTYSLDAVTGLKPDLEKLNLKLAQAQIKLSAVSPLWKDKIIPKKYQFFQNTISDGRIVISSLTSLVDYYDEIFGTLVKKQYLIVFQNPAELRATGGFIGSFALVSFDQGKLTGFKIYDIYDADGQLRGQIPSPDEILHFLGQPNWYMRDSNWSADFPLTAKRLEWFLDKEIGEKVDGVVAVDVHAIEKFLKATGPVKLPDYDETVDSSNLFQKAEFRAEINFFPGSTQKRDYLNAVLTAMLTKIQSGAIDYPGLATLALTDSFKEKNILFYSNNDGLQSVFANNGWAGEIKPKYCQDSLNPCLSIIDSNLGANKANFYIKRSIDLNASIGKAGQVDYTLTINYQNSSPNNTWPGGDYKDYLRVLVPPGFALKSFDQGDSRQMVVSPILTAKTLASLKVDQFLVHQSTESGYTSIGSFITVPVASSKTITLKLSSNSQVDLHSSNPKLNLNLIKQPGTPVENLNLVVEYPNFLNPITSKIETNPQYLVLEQKLVYNTVLDADRNFSISFLLKK